MFGAAGVLSVLALSGCTPPASSPTSTPTATHTSTATAGPKPAATPTDPPTPVGLTCDQVLSADQLYAFNPNFGTDPGYAPKGGTKAAEVVGEQGIACGFLNQTSNSVIEVAVAKPSANATTALKNDAVTKSHVVPTYGIPPEIEGYFTMNGDVGEAQVFTNGYWLVVSSKDFAEPGDPQPLVASVVQNLSAH
jgi:hypothetical protein